MAAWALTVVPFAASALVLAAATVGARNSRTGQPHPNHQKTTKEPTP